MVELWNERFPLPDNDFEFLEPLLALRTSMLQTLVKLRQKENSSPEDVMNLARAYKDLATHLEIQAKVARRSNSPQVHTFSCFIIRYEIYYLSSFDACKVDVYIFIGQCTVSTLVNRSVQVIHAGRASYT